MPRLLNILGFVAFVIGAVALAVAVYILLAGVIGWNPFSRGRPLIAGVTTMMVMTALGLLLLLAGAALALAAARAEWRRERQGMLAS